VRGFDAEALLNPIDHRLGGFSLFDAMGGGGLHIDNYAGVHVPGGHPNSSTSGHPKFLQVKAA